MSIDQEERIQRGIAFLEEKAPAGWRERMNLKELDINDPFRCVLAQAFGSYGVGIRVVPEWRGVGHGFDTRHMEDGGELTEAWRRALSS